MKKSNLFFVGHAGSGKTFCTNYLVKKYGFTHAKMANGVYLIAEKYLNMKNKDRKLLQYLGTEIGRGEINNNLWVNRFSEDIYIAQRTAKDLYNKNLFFCADDIRFKNEFDVLKNAGWVGIYLNVPEEVRIQRLGNRDGNAQVNTLQHESETVLDEFKHELIQLDASGTLDDTFKKLEEIIKNIGGN